jgi:hypothetical protein
MTWNRHSDFNARTPQRETFLANPAGRKDQERTARLAAGDAHRSNNLLAKAVSFTKGSGFMAKARGLIRGVKAHASENTACIGTNGSGACIA